MNYALDTSVLMNELHINYADRYFVSSLVIEELNNLKDGKNAHKSILARKALKTILYNRENFSLCPDHGRYNDFDSMDLKIIKCYKDYFNSACVENGFRLLTADVGMYLMASTRIETELAHFAYDHAYNGYKEISMSPDSYMKFCSDFTNRFQLLTNEYLLIRDEESGAVVDSLKWNGKEFIKPKTRRLRSSYFDIGPIEDDPTQKFAFDSLYSEDITMLFGKAGCGKTTLALAYLMSQLENNKVGKIYVVHAFKKLRDSESLGFLPGSKNEKILSSGIGGILAAKLGSREDVVSVLVNSGQLEIIPTAELRGIEFESDAAVLVTEAQNFDPYAMKTLIQRGREGCKFIIEGDMLEQTDIRNEVNGMERLVDVFKGSRFFSCVKLKKNNRNPIGAIADEI